MTDLVSSKRRSSLSRETPWLWLHLSAWVEQNDRSRQVRYCSERRCCLRSGTVLARSAWLHFTWLHFTSRISLIMNDEAGLHKI